MCLLTAPSLAGPAAKLTVHLDKPGPEVGAMLCGVFFEEINLAGDGGLYGELVPNQSFEDSDKPEHRLLVTAGSAKGIIGNEVPGHIQTGRWYDVRVETKGPNIRCYLDGKRLCQARHEPVNPLHAVAGRAASTGEIVTKVDNVTKTPYETRIALSGVKQVEPSGTAIVLTSASVDDENTCDQPMRVAPVRRTVTRLSSCFDHTFQPHSLTILSLMAK